MAGNPFDQFDASASAAPAAGGNPFDQFDAKGGAAKITAPSDTDYSNSPFSAAGRTLAESAGLGAGDLIYSHLAGTSLAHEQAKTAAAAASLPWYVRYPLEATGYTLGAGSLLSGVPEAAGITGIGAMALEGGLAGGASSILHSDDPSLGGVLAGAAGGAALGGVAGGAVKGLNVGLQKTLGKAASVDPAAAIASTAKDSADAYAALHQKPADPTADQRRHQRRDVQPRSQRRDRHVAGAEEHDRSTFMRRCRHFLTQTWARSTPGNGRSTPRRSASGIRPTRLSLASSIARLTV